MQKPSDAFNYAKGVISTIIAKIDGMSKPRRKFILHLFELFMGMRGRYNFMNLARYGEYCEQSYRNNFSQPMDFMAFNKSLIQRHCSDHKILAFDPSYIPKSGKHTEHLGMFWSGVSQRALRGLEIGGIAVVDIENNTALSLEAVQTPSPKALKSEGKTLIDHYAQTLVARKDTLRSISAYLAVDGYFAKTGFIEAITQQTGLHIVSKLRCDADLKYLYNGPKKSRRGAPRKFDGKINIKQPDKSRITLEYDDEHCKVYSGVVWSTRLKRKIKIAYVEWWKDAKYSGQYAVLFSTDLQLDGYLIYQYYKSRFQIEFLYRDAKQYTGLNHCQARDEIKLHFHFNASLTTVSLAKAIHYLSVPREQRSSFSMEDVKTLYANKIMAQRIFSNLDLDVNCKKIRTIYMDALFFGRKAA